MQCLVLPIKTLGVKSESARTFVKEFNGYFNCGCTLETGYKFLVILNH